MRGQPPTLCCLRPSSGYSHFTGGFPGGQATHVRVPYGNVNLLKIPDDVPDEQALYLSDVLPTSYHAVVDTGVEEGSTVGVWGAGPIGRASTDVRVPDGLAADPFLAHFSSLNFSLCRQVGSDQGRQVGHRDRPRSLAARLRQGEARRPGL